MARGLFGYVLFYCWNILLLKYFTIRLFLCFSMLFYCVDVSTVGNVFGPSHNPCQSQPRPKA